MDAAGDRQPRVVDEGLAARTAERASITSSTREHEPPASAAAQGRRDVQEERAVRRLADGGGPAQRVDRREAEYRRATEEPISRKAARPIGVIGRVRPCASVKQK